MPHKLRKAFITIEHRHTALKCTPSIVKRAPALSSRIEGTLPTNYGVLTLELKVHTKARPSKKRRI
jgi:hypothetical protein